MAHEIKLITLQDQPVLVVRDTLPVEKLPEFFGRAYGNIMAYLAQLGEQPTGMPFGAYYNLDMSALDVAAGFPVAKKLPDKEKIQSQVIPGGDFITTIHYGAYDSVSPAYDALAQWAKANHREATGTAYEYYLNDPSSDPSIIPETEIRIALK